MNRSLEVQSLVESVLRRSDYTRKPERRHGVLSRVISHISGLIASRKSYQLIQTETQHAPRRLAVIRFVTTGL
jgi:hypothetical protein